ncbi:polysaccharide biosynthesis/export family protein [Jannaschia ovalis]|uniref:Polysaccharide biosynthesis/export family protein n=1 Tax=Jannaschia ovalis TaxID=3038773 RepID=A0ABY8LBK1_9RHOB|nr:polysaccharide biosynthesis/export family protein [Jannaschia sp. GRR-S6-38]WGH78716.1 polysaccharide biosynthesis/export family protein [Jannaschia sp. GRR-S6-38]
MADGYAFDAGDRIAIRAGWWDYTSSEFKNWDGVSGEYLIARDGTIQVPLAGTVEAAGQDAASLAVALSNQIQRRIGLSAVPEVAVEIVSHVPIYVAGAVSAPGEYSFRHGLTVQQALALAGGLGAADDPATGDSAERDRMRYEGQINVLTARIETHEAEEARLTAEIAALDVQTVGGNDARIEKLSWGIESELFDARQRSIDTRQANILELQSVVRERLSRLEEQIALRMRQLETAREDVAAMEDLKERGLAVRSSETAALSNVANLEAQIIQLDVARLEAEQQLNLANRDEITLYDEARLGRLSQLKEVRLELATDRAQLETARKLYSEAVARSGHIGTEVGDAVLSYVVTRTDGDETDRFPADLLTRLEPGDTLEVEIEPFAGTVSQ